MAAAVGLQGAFAPYNNSPISDVPSRFVDDTLRAHEELFFLADPEIQPPDVTQASTGITPSMSAFDNNRYPLFDRAINALYNLELIFSGKYQDFIAGQKDNPLSMPSFLSMKEEGGRFSKQALSVALILKNVCQAPKFREVFDDHLEYDGGGPHVFWRLLLQYLQNNNQQVLSYFELQQEERLLVSLAAALARFDQIFKGELEPYVFEPLASIPQLDPEVLHFALFVERCDAAGRAPFNQEVFDRYKEVEQLCLAKKR